MSPSVYQSFRLINIVSRIFGVMPLKMVPGDRNTGPVCLLSTLDYAYSCVWLVLSVVHTALAPFYVLHTIMPYEYKDSIFAALSDPDVPPSLPANLVIGGGHGDNPDDISMMATVMKILNPIMISVSSICSRLVALTFLHRKYSEFITVLHNTDRLMEASIRSYMCDKARKTTFTQTFDKHLL